MYRRRPLAGDELTASTQQLAALTQSLGNPNTDPGAVGKTSCNELSRRSGWPRRKTPEVQFPALCREREARSAWTIVPRSLEMYHDPLQRDAPCSSLPPLYPVAMTWAAQSHAHSPQDNSIGQRKVLESRCADPVRFPTPFTSGGIVPWHVNHIAAGWACRDGLLLAAAGVPHGPRGWPHGSRRRHTVTLESAGVITPEAQAVLDRMTATLKSLDRFSLSAQITRDEVLPFGYKLQNHESAHMWVQRPDPADGIRGRHQEPHIRLRRQATDRFAPD